VAQSASVGQVGAHGRTRLNAAMERADEEAQPFHELLAEAFDLADPELWRSNTFA
jgi:hypothetical protein